ncbi:hypothetical protein CK556_00245 [Mesoplasma chauliocola]|uniref:PTS system, beta-glucoside-specific IIABC component n=1 Tax=Mesoplasma chauliocola TaxID=216427 RepID=A0A249SMH4_9MOLU|nr:PTS glucose transporter subunit IIABC [Mesoplasma chauliocola]ASZ08797.1 hypothetical protein CK556_00245 [Mesoplasma chauliocola]
MEIKIYAPVDCFAKEMSKCSDPTFANKMLGDGIVIEPKSNKFISPFENATCSLVFDTKHAYGFKVKNCEFLVHSGIDTVNLNGEPFNTKLKPGMNIKKGEEIFSVDLKKIIKKGLSTETPIIFTSTNKDLRIKNFKEGNYSQGELICTFEISESKKVNEENQSVINLETYFGAANKYAQAAYDLNKMVGSNGNYSDVYNCMTRLRFKILDKTKVQENQIKEHKMVKGLIWNGDELQIIIGQDVYKVKDEVSKLLLTEKTTKTKQPMFKRALSTFAGIMVPLIPVFIGAGIIQALIGVFTLFNIMPVFDVTQNGLEQIMNVKGWDIAWLILFAMGKTTTTFLGVLIAASAAKFFKLRMVIGVSLGIIMCSPLLYLGGGSSGMGGSWTLFTLGKVTVSNPELQVLFDKWLTIVITPANLKIFVMIFLIWVAKKLDDWVNSWINPLFELTIRSFLVFLIAGALGFGIFIPIWNFIEGFLGVVMYFIGKLPFGLGLGIYTAIWQIAVVFGIHIAFAIVAMIQSLTSIASGQGGYAIFSPGQSISVYAQLGALIGLIIVTKNKQLKRTAISMVPVGFLGITEPIIYGINLQKKQLFLSGILGAFIAGTFAGAVGVTGRVGTGLGIFEAIGFFQYTIYDPTGSIAQSTGQLSALGNGLLYLAACAIALGTGILFAALSYKERPSEKYAVKSINKKIFNLINKNENLDIEERKKIIKKLEKDLNVISKEDEKQIKDVEKQILDLIKIKSEISALEEKDSKVNTKLILKGKKAIKKSNEEKALEIYNIIENSPRIKKIEMLSKEVSIADKAIEIDKINKIIDAKKEKIQKTLGEVKLFDKKDLTLMMNNYEEALSSLFIAYKIKEPAKQENKYIFKNKRQVKEV